MPDRVRLVLGLVVLLAGLLLPAPPSFACSSSTVSGWTTNDGAGLSASCGTTVVQRPTADAVKVSTNDRGISTHAIPAPVIPAPIAKSCNDLIDNCPTIPEPTTPATPPPPGAPPPITTTVLREAATRIEPSWVRWRVCWLRDLPGWGVGLSLPVMVFVFNR